MNTNEKGKNPLVFVLVGIIAVLLVCIGIIMGKLIGNGAKADTEEYAETPAPTASVSAPAPVIETVHTHSWAAATCVRARTCTTCGTTEGEALGHSWIPASCSFPRTCETCGETEGEPVGHQWMPATTTLPQMCSVCGMAVGEPLSSIHSADRAVDLFTEDESSSKVNSVAVAHSQSLSACESCVLRLREAGYNAFLYEELNKGGYSIQMGVFDNAQDAKNFAEYLHTQPEVRGVSLGTAYATSKTRLSSAAVEVYGSPWW